MTSGHTCNLSEAVSKQKNGIVLVFSEFDGSSSLNQSFHCEFVPKMAVSTWGGKGYCFKMATSTGSYFAIKGLVISDTQIKGASDNNSKTLTSASGITLTNGRFVLRAVIGV